MLIKGEPNKAVCGWVRVPYKADMERKILFRFDANGEYRTDDEAIIARAKRKFEVVEESLTEETQPTKENLRHCKKCDFACETQGELLRHYRESHGKGDN